MVAGGFAQAGGAEEIWILPVPGETPWQVPAESAGESIGGWSADSKSLFLYRPDRLPAVVDRVDIRGARREHWKEIAIADTAGVEGIDNLRVAPDGRSYAYQIVRSLSELDLIEPGK